MCCVKKNRWKSVPNTLKTNMRTYGPSPWSETAYLKYHPKIDKAEKKITIVTVWFFLKFKINNELINWLYGNDIMKKVIDMRKNAMIWVKSDTIRQKKNYRKIGSETEVIRSLNLSIQLILIHLLAVSHRFEQLHSANQISRNTNYLYAFWMIFIKTWYILTTWGAGSPVELETFIITTRSNQPHSWAWESCETKTR